MIMKEIERKFTKEQLRTERPLLHFSKYGLETWYHVSMILRSTEASEMQRLACIRLGEATYAIWGVAYAIPATIVL